MSRHWSRSISRRKLFALEEVMLEDSRSLCRILPEISTINIKKICFSTRGRFFATDSFLQFLIPEYEPGQLFDGERAYCHLSKKKKKKRKEKKKKKENIFEMIELLVKTQNLFYSLSPSSFASHSFFLSLFYFFHFV